MQIQIFLINSSSAWLINSVHFPWDADWHRMGMFTHDLLRVLRTNPFGEKTAEKKQNTSLSSRSRRFSWICANINITPAAGRCWDSLSNAISDVIAAIKTCRLVKQKKWSRTLSYPFGSSASRYSAAAAAAPTCGRHAGDLRVSLCGFHACPFSGGWGASLHSKWDISCFSVYRFNTTWHVWRYCFILHDGDLRFSCFLLSYDITWKDTTICIIS